MCVRLTLSPFIRPHLSAFFLPPLSPSSFLSFLLRACEFQPFFCLPPKPSPACAPPASAASLNDPGQGQDRGGGRVHRNNPTKYTSSKVIFSLLFPSDALLHVSKRGCCGRGVFARMLRADFRGIGAAAWVGLGAAGGWLCGSVATGVSEREGRSSVFR